MNTNRLYDARDVHHMVLGDVNITDIGNNVMKPLVTPLNEPISNPMVRRYGQTTIDQRRYGSPSLWADTPVVGCVGIVGDPDITDISDLLADFDDVGWKWDRVSSKLCAYLTSRGHTYIVKVPLKRLQRIFNRHYKAGGGPTKHFNEPTLGGFFKKLGNSLKKFGKHIVKSTIKSITAPIRFIKNPKKFIKDTGNDIKRMVKGAAKTALNVASSPIFAGVMAGLAAIPPLTAIGGIGLAAYAAANAIKPAFKALDKTIDVIDAAKKGKPGGAIKALTSAVGIKADTMTKNFSSGFDSLPSNAKSLMTSALKSTEDKPKSKAERNRRKRLAFRFKPVVSAKLNVSA